jgi:hypothetical protein
MEYKKYSIVTEERREDIPRTSVEYKNASKEIRPTTPSISFLMFLMTMLCVVFRSLSFAYRIT